MAKMISIINYGMGNIRSVENAIKGLNFQVEVITNPNDLDFSEKIILPGVGSFKAAMKLLNEGGWAEKIKYNVLEKNKPIAKYLSYIQVLMIGKKLWFMKFINKNNLNYFCLIPIQLNPFSIGIKLFV